jgi:hypothetical protein
MTNISTYRRTPIKSNDMNAMLKYASFSRDTNKRSQLLTHSNYFFRSPYKHLVAVKLQRLVNISVSFNNKNQRKLQI